MFTSGPVASSSIACGSLRIPWNPLGGEGAPAVGLSLYVDHLLPGLGGVSREVSRFADGLHHSHDPGVGGGFNHHLRKWACAQSLQDV